MANTKTKSKTRSKSSSGSSSSTSTKFAQEVQGAKVVVEDETTSPYVNPPGNLNLGNPVRYEGAEGTIVSVGTFKNGKPTTGVFVPRSANIERQSVKLSEVEVLPEGFENGFSNPQS